MSTFSELLSSYVEKSPYNKMQLAKVCNIERSLFQKILSGERKPRSEEFVNMVAEKLMISTYEKLELLEQYRILNIGKRLYYQRKYVRSLIMEFSELLKTPTVEMECSCVSDVDMSESVISLSGTYNITNYIHNIISAAAVKESCDIFLSIHPENNLIMPVLMNLCIKNNVTIKHLLSLNAVKDDEINDNINILKGVLPFVFSECKYESRYYYENNRSHMNTMQIFPNTILVDGYIILFDYQIKNALFIKEISAYRMLIEIFEKKWDGAYTFAKKSESFEEYNTSLTNIFQAEQFVLFGAPCVLLGAGREFLERSIKRELPKRKEFIDRYINAFQQSRTKNEIKTERPMIQTFFTKKALRMFMESGILHEFPDFMLNNPIDQKDRLMLLKKLAEYIRRGKCTANIIDEKYLDIDEHLLIQLIPNVKLILNSGSDEKGCYFVEIKENSIIMALHDYCNSLIDSGFVMRDTEVLAFLDIIIKEYSDE